jgi:c-di-AMP phosphodiesterase-like protein
MKEDKWDNRLSLARSRAKIPDEKLLMGSTKGKYPVVLDDGKTIIYILDETRADEIKAKYELLRNSKFPSRTGNYHS